MKGKRALSEKTKTNIAKLVDEKYASKILDKNLAKYYPDFDKIKNLKIDTYKRHLGVTSAVFVVEFDINYLNKEGKNKKLVLFASAHSDGSRYEAYRNNKILYQNGFDKGQFRVTRPLFFVREQRAFFYEGSPGRSFFNFFTQNPQSDMKSAFALSAGWIKKLHQTKTAFSKHNWPIFNVAEMVPPPNRYIEDFFSADEKLGKVVSRLIEALGKLEKKNYQKIDKTLVYGDYHPENVIIENLKADHLEMIDFTDVALGDPMLDLGTFIQQFDFMGHNFVSRDKINKDKTYFVESYFEKPFKEIEIDFINRINLYQSWTALRSAVFLFYMKDVDNPVDDLLLDSVNYLKLAQGNNKKINLH